MRQANTVKFLKLSPETAQRVAKRSFQFWFAGIIFSIINGALKVRCGILPSALILTGEEQTVRLNKEARRLQGSAQWGEKDLGEEAARETRLSAITR
jgi:peroxin-11B